MKHFPLFIGLFLGFITLDAKAQGDEIPTAFTLKEAQEYAVKNSYNSQSAAMDVRKAKQKVKETRAIGLPQVNGKVEFQDFLVIPTTVVPAEEFAPPGTPVDPNAGDLELQFGVQYNLTAGVTVSQLLFDGTYLVGLQAAKTYVDVAQNERIKTEIEIRNEVTKAYANVLLVEENVGIIAENIQTLKKIYNDTKLLFENGFAEQTDVDQLQLTLKNLENNLRNTERQKEIVRNLLKFTMGLPIENKIELTEGMDDILSVSNQAAFVEQTFDVNNHIDYRSILLNEEAQILLRKQASSRYLPSLNAFYSYQENYNRPDLNLADNEWFPSSILGATLNIPIFSSFQRKNQVEQAKVEVERAEMMKEQVEETLTLAAKQAKSNYSAALDNYETEKENLALAKRIKNNTFTKYKEGLASSFDLNQAQNQELQNQRTYLAAMVELINAKAELDMAFGNYNE